MRWIAIISEGASSTAQQISIKLLQLFSEIGFQSKIVYIQDIHWHTADGLTVDKNTFSIHEQNIQFDCAYIYSEGIRTKGYIQGYLSLMNIPYVSSSPLATMLTTNKFFCKNYLNGFNIKTPAGFKINNKQDIPFLQIVEEISFPCIVKPNIGTDSIGVTKVTTFHDLEQAIFSLLNNGEEALVEPFIEGRELTCGVFLIDGIIKATPIMEIFQYDESFYSYSSKINRNNRKKTPANLTSQQVDLCHTISKKVFEILELKDFVRIDYILKDDVFYLLEVNITPGMSERSNFPIQLKEMGIHLDNFFQSILNSNILKNQTVPITNI